MFELRLVRHALALGRYRNFARAAEALHLTQPSLSRSIAALERNLGVRLFDRGKNGVRPTAFGELLLRRGAALLDDEFDLRREIQLLAGLEAGTLCVGSGPYPAEISVGKAVARFLAQHPRVRVEVICADPDEIAHRVLGGQFDVGVASQGLGVDSERIRFEPLPRHRILLACRPGHPLATRRSLCLEDIRAYPLAASVLPVSAAAKAADGSALGRIDPARAIFVPSLHVNSLSVARDIAAESDALFPATADMLASDLAAGRLATLDLDMPELTTEYGVMTLSDRSPVPAVAAFVTLLREVEAAVAARERAAEATADAARPTARARGASATRAKDRRGR
jgi:DNA-binding transcriptional LysR family regulator